jgi:hypothetical protein
LHRTGWSAKMNSNQRGEGAMPGETQGGRRPQLCTLAELGA